MAKSKRPTPSKSDPLDVGFSGDNFSEEDLEPIAAEMSRVMGKDELSDHEFGWLRRTLEDLVDWHRTASERGIPQLTIGKRKDQLRDLEDAIMHLEEVAKKVHPVLWRSFLRRAAQSRWNFL